MTLNFPPQVMTVSIPGGLATRTTRSYMVAGLPAFYNPLVRFVTRELQPRRETSRHFAIARRRQVDQSLDIQGGDRFIKA